MSRSRDTVRVLAVVAGACLSLASGGVRAGERAAALVLDARADALLQQGEFAGALELYERSVARDGNDARAWQGRGAALVRLGRLEDAIASLERAAQLDPVAPRVHLDLGLAYLAHGDLFWAADELAAADTAAPGDPAVACPRGLVLWRLGETDAARDEFERAQDDPACAATARFYLGLIAAGAGDTERAQAELRRVLDEAPGTEQAAAAAELSDALLERDWDVPPLLSGIVAVGGQYDSNVILEPNDAEHISGAAAGGLVLRGRFDVAPVSSPTHLLRAGVAASRTFNFADPAAQLDLTAFTAAAGYRLRFAAAGLSHALQASYRYDLGLLDGGNLTDDPGFYAYRDAHSAAARYTLDEGGRWSTFVETTYRHATYADMRRDADVALARFGQNMAFWSERLKLLLSAGGTYENARGRGYDLWGVEASLGISVLGPWSLQFLGLARYQHQDHFDSAFYSGWGPGRIDDAVALTVSVTRPIWEMLQVEVSWTHTEHVSSATPFDYRRDLAGLTLQAVFE